MIVGGGAAPKHQQRLKVDHDINDSAIFFPGLGRKLRIYYICIIKLCQVPANLTNEDWIRLLVV